MREEKFKFHSNNIVCRFIFDSYIPLSAVLSVQFLGSNVLSTVLICCALLTLRFGLCNNNCYCCCCFFFISLLVLCSHSLLSFLWTQCDDDTFVAGYLYIFFGFNANFDVAFWYSRCLCPDDDDDVHDLFSGDGVLFTRARVCIHIIFVSVPIHCEDMEDVE